MRTMIERGVNGWGLDALVIIEYRIPPPLFFFLVSSLLWHCVCIY